MIDWTSPVTIGFANFLGLSFLGILAAFGQALGKRKEAAPPATKDVIVDSVTIADRVALERLAETLRASNEIARDHRQHDADIYHVLVAIKDGQARQESLLGRMLDRLK